MCNKGPMGKHRSSQASDPPATLIPRTLNESQHVQTVHLRTIKELVECRSENRERFLAVWCQCLRPIFLVQEKELNVERVVRLVTAFSVYRDKAHENECDAFVEEFLKHLLQLAAAANKTVRFRACQLIAEVMTRLAEDVEVNEELYEAVISGMRQRMQDKVPGVRMYAARSLSRLIPESDEENDPTLSIYRQALEFDRSADVRKMVVMSVPAINTTIPQVVERTADVSDAVRKAAYSSLGSKFPIPTLSIRQRCEVLERGLADRVSVVQDECLNMLKTAWLNRDCEGNIITLLRYLDVETHEKVGESVLIELLKEGLILPNKGEGLRQFILPLNGTNNPENRDCEVQLLGAEQALYWRVLCSHLQADAQTKGAEAATTGGAQSVVTAAAAVDANNTLDSILPPTVEACVKLVNAHLSAGPHYRFAARQLLLLAKLLDFTDTTNRKVAGSLLRSLLLAETRESEQDALQESDPDMFIGDGLSLGGDQGWAVAVSELAVKVHSEQGEFEKVVAGAVSVLGQPCRDGGAKVSQWLHCLAVTSLLLERLSSLHQLDGWAIEAQEIVDALLLPAVKHAHIEVQKAGLRCLGLFGQLPTKASAPIVRQLRICLSSGIAPVQNMAIKSLFDLVLCHGAALLDCAIGIGPDLRPVPEPRRPGLQVAADTAPLVDGEGMPGEGKGLLDVLVSLLSCETILKEIDRDTSAEAETSRSLVAEGFAKLLLQRRLFKDVQPIEEVILAQLLHLYFNEDTELSPRLQQCLSVFFKNYSVLSAETKKCIARAFIPLMRSEWPGLYGHRGGTLGMVSARKRAIQLSRFLLQLLQYPLLPRAKEQLLNHEVDNPLRDADPDVGEERLAINIAVEVRRLSAKSTASAKAYMVMMARTAAALEFRPSQQEKIKCMIQLLGPVMDAVSGDKPLTKELKVMVARLKSMDMSPQQGLSEEQLQLLLDSLELNYPAAADEDEDADGTPAFTSKNTAPKNVKQGQMMEETPKAAGVTRPQRQSKTEALQRLSHSAAKHRGPASSGVDAANEQTPSTTATDTTDTTDDASTETRVLEYASSTGEVRRATSKITRAAKSASKKASLPSAAKKVPKPLPDSSNAESIDNKGEKVMIPPPRARQQVSVTTESTLNSQDSNTIDSKSDMTMEDTVVSSNAGESTSSDTALRGQPVFTLDSDSSDEDFQRLQRKLVRKSVPAAAKRLSTRRSAWK